MTIYACIKDGAVVVQLRVADPEDGVGPPTPLTVIDEFDSVVTIPEAIVRTPDVSSTSFLHRIDGEFQWVETAPDPLTDLKTSTILKIDAAADLARAKVVGDPVRVTEYTRAQLQAEAYRDAGFTGQAGSCVRSWASACGWTDRQSAEDILAAAARWLGALDYIRDLRLHAKKACERATTIVQVNQIASIFFATLAAAMQGVQ
jgi:hypothetical protein